ncbi:ADP-ribosylation factor protein 3 [Malassezia brasiliensis]|uniref:ADP-ribosylation factor protein 3 n=1 Tax=Malassezia brasiliensis TaxID=1821822 RepID=A0AAF0INE4_9BASI|nr:ADP-ribosylation factor protein 3 [Malassezia brasiliensis]
MYHLLAGLYAEVTKKPTYHVLLVGLKGAGKTWILEKFREIYCDGPGPSARIAPTVGQNVLNVQYKRSIVHFWDLGGAASMRSLWDEYLPDAHTLVWVIDAPRWAQNSVDAEGPYRDAVCTALFHLVQDAAARNLPILVVAAQLDRLEPNLPTDGIEHISGAGVQEHIYTTLLKRWALLVEEDTSAATLKPDWDVVGVSAASSDGMRVLLDTIHARAMRFATSKSAP